jgi:hypothetical protein
MSGRGLRVDVRIAHTVAYLLWCPRSLRQARVTAGKSPRWPGLRQGKYDVSSPTADPRTTIPGGALVAQRGRSTPSIAAMGGGLPARRQRQQWEDPATTTLKRLVGLRGWGGDDNNDVNLRGDDDDNTTISLAMATATRVAGNKEGDGGKSDGKGERRQRRWQQRGRWRRRQGWRATKRAMARAEGGKSDGDRDEEGNGKEEGEGGGGESNYVYSCTENT